jgi:hypothetical protein
MATRPIGILQLDRRSAAFLLLGGALAACGSVNVDKQSGGAGAASGAGGATSTATAATTGGGGNGGIIASATSSSASGLPPCDSGPDQDLDHDGFTVAEGDCNDCDYQVNPNAIEIIVTAPLMDGGVPVPVDDDCNGLIDDIAPLCDTGLVLADADPLAAAHAIDICKASTGPASWGLVHAAWVLADGAPLPTDPAQLAKYHLGHGILSDLGPNNPPMGGARVLALSTGTARRPSDPGYQSGVGFDKGFASGAPPGFPTSSPSCSGIVSGGPRDAVALDVQLRPPGNAGSFRFNFSVFSRSWPDRVCSVFDDQFVVLQDPAPMGAISGNIAFDQKNWPVALNLMLPEVCSCAAPPCFAPPAGATEKPYDCPSGASALVGTGFEGSAGLGWLQATSPVASGDTFSLRFAVWDGEDGLSDTTVLVDHFQWIAKVMPVSTGTGPPPK